MLRVGDPVDKPTLPASDYLVPSVRRLVADDRNWVANVQMPEAGHKRGAVLQV
jgi:hypothetical protein